MCLCYLFAYLVTPLGFGLVFHLRFEEQEAEMKELRNTLKEDDTTDKPFRLEHLKESLDTSFRLVDDAEYDFLEGRRCF